MSCLQAALQEVKPQPLQEVKPQPLQEVKPPKEPGAPFSINHPSEEISQVSGEDVEYSDKTDEKSGSKTLKLILILIIGIIVVFGVGMGLSILPGNAPQPYQNKDNNTITQTNTSPSTADANTTMQTYNLKVNNQTYPIKYNITGGNILRGIYTQKIDTLSGKPFYTTNLGRNNSKLLYLDIDKSNSTLENGTLTIELPRNVIESRNGTMDKPFKVYSYAVPMQYTEITNNSQARTLAISLDPLAPTDIDGTRAVPKVYRYDRHLG